MKYFNYKIDGAIAQVTISRPEALNALNSDVLNEIQVLVQELESIAEVRVAILTGDGKAFVAGADIAEMQGLTDAQATEFSRNGQKSMQDIENSRILWIAAINGFALGGGLELALACDIRFASEKAKLGFPEVKLGLVPGFGGSQRIGRLCGTGKALEYVTSAQMVDAQTAYQDRLVNKVFSPEELAEKSLEFAKSVLVNGPNAVLHAKRIVYQGLDQTLAQGMETEATTFGSLFGKPESKEGMTAFLEKRPAKY